MKFSDLGLRNELLQAISDLGFKETTGAQAEAIPLALQGEDMIVQAKTGTGKTAAFVLPILQWMDYSKKKPTVLVMTPTRELAQQVYKEFLALGKYTKPKMAIIYGGVGYEPQIQALEHGAQIVVGTPGRLLDLHERKDLDLTQIQVLVLDEADKMFEMGFREDIEKVIHKVPKTRQTLLYSATMSSDILDLARRHMHAPVEINHSRDTLTVENIDQSYLMVDPRKKMSALRWYIKNQHIHKAVIFCRTKMGADRLTRELRKWKFDAVAMHGDFSQAKRERALQDFKHGKVQFLLATNLASRGLQIDDVSHVINYDFPEEIETYVHRIGRTARQGKKGTAVSFLKNMLEKDMLEQVEKKAKCVIKELSDEFK